MAKPTVLLYPGAGSDREQSSLVAIERTLGSAASVERLDFPYRRQGRRAPDRAPKLMAAMRDDLKIVRRRRGPVVMGGRSMG
jgi:predicted alpha/beta-hydrolase family hydrolase